MKKAVQAWRTMIVVVFVPEAFLCPSVARSLPLMSRSARCLEFDVLELSRTSLVNASGSTKRFVRVALSADWEVRANNTGCVDGGAANLLH